MLKRIQNACPTFVAVMLPLLVILLQTVDVRWSILHVKEIAHQSHRGLGNKLIMPDLC